MLDKLLESNNIKLSNYHLDDVLDLAFVKLLMKVSKVIAFALKFITICRLSCR